MTALADFDDLVDAMQAAAEMTPEAFAALPAPEVANGLYTLATPDGSHRTFRVRLEKNGTFAGKRTVALLIGPQNTTDFENQGTVERDGFAVWKRFKNTRTADQLARLWRLLHGEVIDGHEVTLSKRCMVCNRTLTTPESYARGIGPNCAERMGVK